MSAVYGVSDGRLTAALVTIVFLVMGAIVGAYASGSARAAPESPVEARHRCSGYCERAGGELAEMEVFLGDGGTSVSCVCFFGAIDPE